jgi:hypothetical protein
MHGVTGPSYKAGRARRSALGRGLDEAPHRPRRRPTHLPRDQPRGTTRLVQGFPWCASVAPSPDSMPTFWDRVPIHEAAFALCSSSFLIGRPLSDGGGNGRLDSFSCSLGLVSHEVSAMSPTSTLCASLARGDTPQLLCGVIHSLGKRRRRVSPRGHVSATRCTWGTQCQEMFRKRGVFTVGAGSPRVLDTRGLLARRRSG